jgi:hypothetical protein
VLTSAVTTVAPFLAWLLLDSRVVDVLMAYNPTFVMLSFLKPLFFNSLKQWSGQKSGSDSAVRSEFLIAGMIFHPSRVKS